MRSKLCAGQEIRAKSRARNQRQEIRAKSRVQSNVPLKNRGVKMAVAFSITLEDAQLVLQPRLPALAGALKLSTHTWRTTLGRHQARLTEYSRAVAINEMWYSNSELLLSTDPGVSRGRNVKRDYLRFDDKLILRIKHVGDSLRPWTQRTRRSREWEAQRRFQSIPPLPRLDLIYRARHYWFGLEGRDGDAESRQSGYMAMAGVGVPS